MLRIILIINLIIICLYDISLAQDNFAIKNVNVIPMTDTIVLENQTILIFQGIINDIGHTNAIDIPQDYVVINGKGQYILPGLINMYTHVNESNLLLYLANGQTTVRDIPSHINVLGLREQIKKKEILGPRILCYGLRATGAPAPYHSQQPIFTVEQGIEQVHETKRLGYDGMYIYATCLPEAYQPILDEAQKIELPISGHFPIFIREEQVLKSKQPEFTNLTGLTRGGKLVIDKDKLLDHLKRFNKAVTPSLVVHKNWSLSHKKDSIYNSDNMKFIPPKLRANWKPAFNVDNRESSYPYDSVASFINELSNNDIQLFLGSDGGYPLVVPGFAYLDEMELFVEAGISTYKTLKYATVDAANFLSLKEIGTIEVGNLAELILLNSNPLKDINALRNIKGIMLNNKWLDENFLLTELSQLKRNIRTRADRFRGWEEKLKFDNKTKVLNYTFFIDEFEVGEQRLLIDTIENNAIAVRSVMVADAPDYRETYSYHRIKNREVDSLSIINLGGEGITNTALFIKQDSVYISGSSPFHGNFEYVKFAPPKTQLWCPFISRYFELDNIVNYYLAQSLNKNLESGEATIFKTIQIELNSEEYGEKYIVDESSVTIFKTSQEELQIIYPGFSGFPNRTSLPFNVNVKLDNENIIDRISFDNYKIKRRGK